MVKIIKEILENLYFNQSPYLTSEEKYIDTEYPHTNIVCDLLCLMFQQMQPNYIVKCGSMLGGSAIRMAETLKRIGSDAEIICIDPFTGDVNMWDWECEKVGNGGWRFLRLENGIPTIYKRFLANCKFGGYEHRILPIQVTTTVGIKLLHRLYQQKRITELPNYIYLDSAHEKDETFIELSLCWNCLTGNSVLFGDDWCWEPVKTDVMKFAQTIKQQTNYNFLHILHNSLSGSQIIDDNILLYRGQWVLCKIAHF